MAIAAPLFAGLLLVPQIWLFANVIQAVVVERASAAAVFPNVMAVVALMAARALLVWSGEVRGSRAAARITLTMREALFGHLLRQRPDWSASRRSGELSSAIVDQVGSLEAYFARYVPAMALAAALPVAFAVVALWVEPIVGVLFLMSAPLIPVFMALVGWSAEAASVQHQQSFLRLSGFFADRLRGLVTLKLLGRGADEAARLRTASEDLRIGTLAVLRIAFLSSAVLEVFAALGVASVALYIGLTYLGFLHMHAGPLSLRTGLFCLMLAPEVYFPLRQFAAHYHDRAAAKAAVAGLETLFGAWPSLAEAREKPTPRGDPALRRTAEIVVANLTVMTPDGRRSILRDANATVEAGSRVAIVGASGTGKSSLLEAIAGFRSFQGRIEIDGTAITEIPEHEFRRLVAVLGQRPRLFHGTIAENVRFGRQDASDDEIRQAAARAGVLRFAQALPEGLATRVGEGGTDLSGGEAHRVALARIFLRQPAVILLDEPTAHLDPETERAVLDGIIDFANGRTLVIVTHSSTVMARMQRILRIEDHGIRSARDERAPFGPGVSRKFGVFGACGKARPS